MSDDLVKHLPTSARVSLGITGVAIPVQEHLRFQLDHALARDGVHASLDVPALERLLHSRGLTCLTLQSSATGSSGRRDVYLRRPDLGRTLHPASRALLESLTAPPSDIVFVLADGLSSRAVERHALALLDATLLLLPAALSAPVVIATQARVALGDEIGELLRARLVVVLIGERPGLSSPDSLGAYITWDPQPGRSDAERNCISNIHAEGLSYEAAAQRIAYFVREAHRLQLTGVRLKDPDSALAAPKDDKIEDSA
jgi:ethanolamine ammonia-lyase small subunit